MNIHADKAQSSKGQLTSNDPFQTRNRSARKTDQLDHDSLASPQAKLQDMVSTSPRVIRLLSLQDRTCLAPLATESAPLQDQIHSAPLSPIQRLAKPAEKNKKYSTEDAIQNLEESRNENNNPIMATWIAYILNKIKPKAGLVKRTYVSSFDTPKGGFSASRELPDIDVLVVHVHYKREKGEREQVKVNSAQVKWADNETGPAPAGQSKLTPGKEREILGDDHEQIAIQAWEQNPERHKLRADAEASKNSKQKDETLYLDWLFQP